MYTRKFFLALVAAHLFSFVTSASAQTPTSLDVTAGSFLMVFRPGAPFPFYDVHFQLAAPGYSIAGTPGASFSSGFMLCFSGCIKEEIINGRNPLLQFNGPDDALTCWAGGAGFDSTRASHHANPKTQELTVHGLAKATGRIWQLGPPDGRFGCMNSPAEGPMFNLVGKWHWTAHFKWEPTWYPDGTYIMTDLLITYHDDDDPSDSTNQD